MPRPALPGAVFFGVRHGGFTGRPAEPVLLGWLVMSDDDLRNAPVWQLLGTYRAILGELRRRGIVRTSNAPTGDYAEYLVARFFGGELAPNSERSWDVLAPSGVTVQVKARVSPEGSGAGTRQLSAIRTWGFDQLAVVLFDDDYSIRTARLLPVSAVRAVATFVPHVNGYRVVASDEFLAGGVDITDELRAVAARI